jgi:hypothetical protein
MRNFLTAYSTPITVALFVVVVVTGVPIFFHVGDRFLKGAHEWLSLAFVVAAFLHVARHWRGFVAVMKQRRAHVLLAASGLALALFVGPALIGGPRGGNPMMALAGKMTVAPLEDLASALGTGPEHLIARLEAGGLSGVDPSQSAKAIAAAHGQPLPKVVAILIGN